MELNHSELQQIGRELTDLWSEMLELESEISSKPLLLHDAHHKSARNLVYYLALRRPRYPTNSKATRITGPVVPRGEQKAT